MKRFILLALASASAGAMATGAAAQATSTTAANAPEQATLGEIVVTARRRAESLKEVPQTVNAVTSDTLQKLNITQFSDVQRIVPGLSLENSSSGLAATASLRGVTFDVRTANQNSTVALYLNDAPVQSQFLFSSLYDVGQVEVLRGPQGTTRGVSAPSGAITVTTRRPDLSDFGGYINGTVTDLQGRNLQGAINIPVIKDVLAIRLAGVIDQNDLDGVRSIHNSLRPSQKTAAERITVSFEPSDRFNATVAYQHLDRRIHGFDQVTGPGQGSSVNPPITAGMLASVEDGVSDARNHLDIVTAQFDSRIFGQHLSYVGSYQHETTHTRNMAQSGGSPSDAGNLVPGLEIYNYTNFNTEWTSQELRLASDPSPGRFVDYTVGAFYTWSDDTGGTASTPQFLPGAFGVHNTNLTASAYDPRFAINVTSDLPDFRQETSLFGSVTLHLGANTELSGGVRHIWSIAERDITAHIGSALLDTGVPIVNTVIPCTVLGAGFAAGPSPGVCTLLARTQILPKDRHSAAANIYNVSLSHHFGRDIMVYANTGTAFRPGFTSAGLTGDIATSTDPAVQTLLSHPDERSRSYELGFKGTFLGGRARLNADVFRQRFSNLTIFVPNINYVSATGVTPFPFTQSVDALVQGFEVDSAYQITPDWNISLQASYSDGAVQGSLVPCNTLGANGAPTFNHGVVSLCPGGSASRLPYWNATLTTEYSHPIADQTEGFVRGLLTYYPENKNRVEPNFTVDEYSLVNLYAGVRSQDGAWEVSLFAKNAFRAQRTLDLSPVALGLSGIPASSGYFLTQTTPRREVGVNVHYAFGSR